MTQEEVLDLAHKLFYDRQYHNQPAALDHRWLARVVDRHSSDAAAEFVRKPQRVVECSGEDPVQALGRAKKLLKELELCIERLELDDTRVSFLWCLDARAGISRCPPLMLHPLSLRLLLLCL